MQILTPTIPMDFHEHAFDVAIGMLQTPPNEATILCSVDCWKVAWYLKEKYGCMAVLLPNELLKNNFHWAVRNDHATVWCTGCDA